MAAGSALVPGENRLGRHVASIVEGTTSGTALRTLPRTTEARGSKPEVLRPPSPEYVQDVACCTPTSPCGAGREKDRQLERRTGRDRTVRQRTIWRMGFRHPAMENRSIARVTHVTSGHHRSDTRIFLKECSTLQAHGWPTTLVVADGDGDGRQGSIPVYDVGAPRSRRERLIVTPRRLAARALEIPSDVYHLHDPELLPVGLRLKRAGHHVIFDAHEHMPDSIRGKPYLPRTARPLLAGGFGAYESWACARFDAIVTATPAIRERFRNVNDDVVDVNNYPLSSEFAPRGTWSEKRSEACYVGAISAARGIEAVVAAMALVQTPVRLNLAGRFYEPHVVAKVKAMPGWARVDELGQLDRSDVRRCLARSMAGIVTFLPEPNHVSAQPNKLFEYMGAGIPVIASDFPLWRAIVQENDCGLCVDPADPAAIAGAIDALIADPRRAEEMGHNGRKAVEAKYNWGTQEARLLATYARVMGIDGES